LGRYLNNVDNLDFVDGVNYSNRWFSSEEKAVEYTTDDYYSPFIIAAHKLNFEIYGFAPGPGGGPGFTVREEGPPIRVCFSSDESRIHYEFEKK